MSQKKINTNSPFISIIVPVYNAANWLDRCVASLVGQTFQDIEIILINDGSKDDSLKICDEWRSKDLRITVIHQQQSGVSAARNKGIEASHGQYITFVDSDDWIDLDTCKVFSELNSLYNYDLFCYSAIYSKKDKAIVSHLFAKDISKLDENQKEELFCKIMTPHAPWFEFNTNTRFAGSAWGKFFRKSILVENQIVFSTKTTISEDCLFNITSFDYLKNIGYTSKTNYHYEQRESSAQNKYRPNTISFFDVVIDEMKACIWRKQRSKHVYDSINTLFTHYLFGTLKEDLFHKDNHHSWKYKKAKFLKDILSRPKYKEILCKVNKNYFTTSERILLICLRYKMIRVIAIVMLLQNKKQNRSYAK